jgi:hypothetical protein
MGYVKEQASRFCIPCAASGSLKALQLRSRRCVSSVRGGCACGYDSDTQAVGDALEHAMTPK